MRRAPGSGRVLYLDASALVKLVVREPESDALAAVLAGRPILVSSIVAGVEVRRAVARASEDTAARERADRLLETVELRVIDGDVVGRAAGLRPTSIRSLDAIHVGSALTLADELSGFIAYDARLLSAARDAGLPVVTPA